MPRRFLAFTLFAASLIMLTFAVPPSAQAQDAWGAIAFNARGATGTVWNRSSQSRAMRDALNSCRRNATVPCKVLSGANAACGAIALGKRGTQQTAFGVIRPGLSRARTVALDRCESQGFSGCYIRAVMCANGSHKR